MAFTRRYAPLLAVTAIGLASADEFSANLSVYNNEDELGDIYISSDGHAYSDDEDNSYQFAQPITPGQYYTLGLSLDFNTLTTGYYLDGQYLGSLAMPAGAATDASVAPVLSAYGIADGPGVRPQRLLRLLRQRLDQRRARTARVRRSGPRRIGPSFAGFPRLAKAGGRAKWELMKTFRVVSGIVASLSGICIVGYGILGSLFVLEANDGTPKSFAVELTLIALGGASRMAVGVWMIIRASR